MFDIVVAEGNPIDCAMYTHALIEIFHLKSEYDKKKEVDAWMEKFGDKTFEDLMKGERDEEE